MAKLSVATILLLLACLLAVTQAVPVTDVSSTFIGVTEEETSPTSERFAVTVGRVDDLVDEDTNEVVAERLVAVIFNFNLEDDQLLLNNQPVPLGVTSVTALEAEIVVGAETEEELEAIEQNFDTGIVKVEVTTSVESFPTDIEGVSLRRITILTRVLEVEKLGPVEIDAVEKILEAHVATDSDAFNAIPATDNLEAPVESEDDVRLPVNVASDVPALSEPAVISEPEPVKKPCPLNTFAQRVAHWWRCSSLFSKIFVSSASLTVFSAFFFIIVPAIVKRAKARKCCRRESPNAGSPPEYQRVEVVAYEEKEKAILGTKDEAKLPLMGQ